MRPATTRVLERHPAYHRDDLAATIESLAPRFGVVAEHALTIAFLCAFWGLVVFSILQGLAQH